MPDFKIDGLPDAAALVDADLVELHQPGRTAGDRSRKSTLATLRSFFTQGLAARDAVTALTISSGTVNIDCSLGDFFTLVLTANVTAVTFTNLPAAGRAVSLAVQIRQDGSGGRTLAIPANFRATVGSDTVVQTAANSRTLMTLTTFDQGVTWEYTMRGVVA
jgi:hypothetical protein